MLEMKVKVKAAKHMRRSTDNAEPALHKIGKPIKQEVAEFYKMPKKAKKAFTAKSGSVSEANKRTRSGKNFQELDAEFNAEQRGAMMLSLNSDADKKGEGDQP